MSSCGCNGAAPGGALWEARTISGQTLEVATGRTQGTRDEAMQAAKGRTDAYLVRTPEPV